MYDIIDHHNQPVKNIHTPNVGNQIKGTYFVANFHDKPFSQLVHLWYYLED